MSTDSTTQILPLTFRDEWREMRGHLARLIAACDALYAGQPHSNEDMQRARDFLAKPQPTTQS